MPIVPAVTFAFNSVCKLAQNGPIRTLSKALCRACDFVAQMVAELQGVRIFSWIYEIVLKGTAWQI